MTSNTSLTDCPTDQLLLYYYGELDGSRLQQVENHLQHCDACRAELLSLQNVLGLLPTNLPALTASELSRFSARVMDQLPRRRYFRRPAIGWALAGTVVVLLSLNLRQGLETPGPEQIRVIHQMSVEQEVMNQLELLQNLDLLENLDLLQQLDRQG
jgi:anti-sigma factor RsiW